MSEEIRGLCLVRGCEWMTTAPANTGMESETMAYVNGLLAEHRETAHPNHQLQVQKCPLRGCAWSLPAWSLPGDEYSADRVRLQKEWSKHMAAEHPTVRGPGTIQVTARLAPLDTPSDDGREIASGALHPLPEDGVPIVSLRGEIVGRVSELREENGWAVVEGFLREDLINEREAASLWRGETLPVSFAVIPDSHTIQGDRPFYVRSAGLRNVRVAAGDESVWDGTGMRATHPRSVPERRLKISGPDELAAKVAMMGVETALRPLRDALEAFAQTLMPAVEAYAQALAEHAKAISTQPQPMKIDLSYLDSDALRRRPFLDELYGRFRAAEGPEDWPRLPRDGKRAPTGCEVCEAPVDGRHPRGCPGA